MMLICIYLELVGVAAIIQLRGRQSLLKLANLFVCNLSFFSGRIYSLQRQKERLEEQVDLANKALAESAVKPKK